MSTAHTAQSSVHYGTCTYNTGTSSACASAGNARDKDTTDTNAQKIVGIYLTDIGLLYASITS